MRSQVCIPQSRTLTRHSVIEPRKHYVPRRKPDTQDQVSHESIYRKYSEQAEVVRGCLGLGMGTGLTINAHETLTGVTEMSPNCNVVMFPQLDAFIKNHCGVHIKWVNVMLCNLYLNNFFKSQGMHNILQHPA